jgi:hypothetical protein
VLSDIATTLRLEDRTEISITPGTICSYSQLDVKYPISLKAWVAGDRIAIDIFQRPPETGETEAYRKLRSNIMTQLKQHFGDRLSLVNKMNQVSSGSAKR